MNDIKFKCLRCLFSSDNHQFHLQCPDCGSNLEIVYDYKNISLRENEFDMFMYPELLPFKDKATLRYKIGGTPLLESKMGTGLFFKDDSRNPSLSLKDRATAIAILHALYLGKKGIATASTGNAASSLSLLSAAVGLKCFVFVPATIPKAKLTQILIFGAKVIMVRGNYDDAFKMSIQFCRDNDVYPRNTGINPFMTEGKKTVSYEIYKQMGNNIPDRIFVSVGDGCIIGGVFKGFKELKILGMIDDIPKIYGIQAEKANPIYNAFHKGLDIIETVHASTRADSICVGNPMDFQKALLAVKESKGDYIQVSEKEIFTAQMQLAKKEGIFAEPAAAAAYAGYLKSEKKGKSVVLITGNGIKDIDAVMEFNDLSGDLIEVLPDEYNGKSLGDIF